MQNAVLRFCSSEPQPDSEKKRLPAGFASENYFPETNCLVIFSKCFVVFSKCFVIFSKYYLVFAKVPCSISYIVHCFFRQQIDTLLNTPRARAYTLLFSRFFVQTIHQEA